MKAQLDLHEKEINRSQREFQVNNKQIDARMYELQMKI